MTVRRYTLARVAATLAASAAFGFGCAGQVGRVPAWELPAPPTDERPVVAAGVLHRIEFENGLQVILLEDHRLPRISIGVTVRRGAGAVDPARAGATALMAETMERGAGKRDALVFAETVDAIGAQLGVSAGWDAIDVQVDGLVGDMDLLVELLGDVVLRPRFDAGEVAKAQSEQLSALERAKDDPSTLAHWHTARALYSGHRYGWPLSGTPETVARLSPEAPGALHAAFFTPGNAVLYASGDLEPESFEGRVRAIFGPAGWPASKIAPSGPPAPPRTPLTRKVVIVDRPDLVQARIALAHEGLARDDERRIAASLMNDVLGGSGFSSRLMASLRAEAGLTYGVSSGFALRRHPGPFIASTFTRVAEVRRAIDLLVAGIEGIRDRPPTSEELADAKSLSAGRFALGLETSDAVMASLVNLAVYGLPADSLDSYRSRVRAVGQADTARLARELLHPERGAIVVVGPAEQLLPLLEGLGQVEVVTP